MTWPKATDYTQAVQNLRQSMDDAELRAGQVAETALGLPMAWAGRFAAAYKIHNAKTGNTWALKCFTRKVTTRRSKSCWTRATSTRSLGSCPRTDRRNGYLQKSPERCSIWSKKTSRFSSSTATSSQSISCRTICRTWNEERRGS